MKKSIIFVILIVIIFSLGACGNSPSPTEVATYYFDALKTEDTDKMNQYYAGQAEDMNLSSSDSALGSEDYDFLSGSSIEEKMLDFDYAITNEKISKDEKTAKVDVAITSYAFGGMIEELMADAITQAFANMFDEDFDMDKYMEEKMASQIESLKKDFNETVTINLEKDGDDNWVISEIPEDSPLINALTGGLVESFADLEDSFSDWD